MSKHLHVHGRRGCGAFDDLLCMSRGADERDDVGVDARIHEDPMVRRCLGIYALYRLNNNLRYGLYLPTELEDAFSRLVREGAR